jgi:glycerophosphoryl diester phosphodiesterase
LRALPARLDQWPGSAVSIHHRLLTPAVIQALHDRGTFVMTWPVNSGEVLARLAAWGVNAMISDSLAIVRELAAAATTMRAPATGESV